MKFQRFRVFTLEDANACLPIIADLTKSTQASLEQIRSAYVRDSDEGDDLERETRMVIDEWARLILEIGAQPKGIFTVDFRAPDPNLLWCWAPGEDRIAHRHYTWESFKDRVQLRSGLLDWPARN